MLQTILNSFIIFYGIIHLLGFAKAYNLSELKEIKVTIDKKFGLLLLFAGSLFIIAGFLLAFESDLWWLPAAVGVAASQFMVIKFWKKFKYATLINLIILVTAIVAYGFFNFETNVKNEIKDFYSAVEFSDIKKIDSSKISNLPKPVKNWLIASNTIGKEIIKSVYLKQIIKMKLSAEQSEWYNATADQYILSEKPAFIWKVNVVMNSLLKLIGRDKLINGKAEMLIKLLGLLSVVDTKNNHKLNEGALQRYLAEIVWSPTSALSKNISWQLVDDSTATAKIGIDNIETYGTFHFGQDSLVNEFSCMRYFGGEENSEQKEWSVKIIENANLNGFIIPTKSSAIWKLEKGDWEWLKVEVIEIHYNSILQK